MNPVELKVELQENAHEFTLGMNEFLESGTKDYKELNNKPSINGVELDGDKTTADLIPIDSDTLEINDDGELTVVGGVGGVTGIKGSAEEEYRQGDVSLSPEDIGTYSKDEIDSRVPEYSVDNEILKLK